MRTLYLTTLLTVGAVLAGCVTAGKPAPPARSETLIEEPTAPMATAAAEAPVDIPATLKEAIDALQVGDNDVAQRHLAAILAQQPDHRVAATLHEQLVDDPVERLGADHFDYTTEAGDSVSLIAKRFLDDPLQFVILARYNGLENPSLLSVGEVLKIPGSRPVASAAPQRVVVETVEADGDGAQSEADEPVAEAVVPPASMSTREVEMVEEVEEVEEAEEAVQPVTTVTKVTTVSAPAVQSIDVDDRQQAERFYRQGLTQQQAGQLEAAYESFSQALAYDPGHVGASAQLGTLRQSLVEENHKQAMVLYRQQALERAIALWDKVLAMDPRHESAQVYRTRAVELLARLNALKSQ